MDQQHHVGLDVSVKETAICIVDPHGKVVHRATVESHPEVISRHLSDLGHRSDPAFIEKVCDVVGLYLAPPDRALVLCIDEKPQIQAAQGTAPAYPLRPGHAERTTHDYRRHGTLDLFAALDVKAGTVIGRCKATIVAPSSARSWIRSSNPLQRI